jgi:hypothetical protein
MSLMLALAVVLALGVSATAQAAPRLTRKEAKRIAVKLGRKQIRKFDLASYHLGKPKRLGNSRIAFPYDARTKSHTYCTAVMTVRKRTRGNRLEIVARIGRQDCLRMPADALAVERVIRQTQRRLHTRATRRSVAKLVRSLGSCENMSVPKSRRAGVAAVIDVATTNALTGPNESVLDRLVVRLNRVDTGRRVLGTGIAGWTDYVDILRSLPLIENPCRALRRWKRAGWSSDAAPIDLGDYRRSRRQAAADERAIARAARFLARVGVFPRTVIGFTPQGLLLHLAPKS